MGAGLSNVLAETADCRGLSLLMYTWLQFHVNTSVALACTGRA